VVAVHVRVTSRVHELPGLQSAHLHGELSSGRRR
jgi:hypothetical protein